MTPKPSRYLIFWTNQADCEQIESGDLAKNCPRYIKRQLSSRYGRAGRGRLWVADGIPVKEITWDDSKPPAKYAGNSGGIVIHGRDYNAVKSLPGMVTDLELNEVKL